MNTTLNETIKSLFREKTVAKMDCFKENSIFYRFTLDDGRRYEFPIRTLQVSSGSTLVNESLSGAKFYPEMKASELARWIKEASFAGELVRLTE